MKKYLFILVASLFISGNVTYADEIGSSDSKEQILIKIIELDKEMTDEMNQIVSEEPEISTYNVKLIEKLPPSGGIPSGIFVSTSRANSNAVTLGYGNAHKFKTTMVKNQKDTTIAHYNMYEVKSSKKAVSKR